MNRNFVCGLDIGTSKTCATCACLDQNGKVDVLASQMVTTQGVKAGQITERKKLSDCIRQALCGLEKMCGRKIKRVYVNIDSPELRVNSCSEELFFDQKTKIRPSHISILVDAAVSNQLSLDRKVVHLEVKDFVVDEQSLDSYPNGCSAARLRLNIAIVSAFVPTVDNFVKCIQGAGLILEDMLPSGCAQAQGLFRDLQQIEAKNYLLIDLGAGLTKAFLFKGGSIEAIEILPLGAASITEEIAAKLNLSFDCAEKLKIRYGTLDTARRTLNQKIIVQDRLSSKSIQLERLSEIINLQVDSLLQQIKSALSKLEGLDLETVEIIASGGGAILEGMVERAEQVLARNVKVGFLTAVKDNYIQTQSALYATCIGLIQYGFKNRGKQGYYKKIRPVAFVQTLNRTKKLYQEYF